MNHSKNGIQRARIYRHVGALAPFKSRFTSDALVTAIRRPLGMPTMPTFRTILNLTRSPLAGWLAAGVCLFAERIHACINTRWLVAVCKRPYTNIIYYIEWAYWDLQAKLFPHDMDADNGCAPRQIDLVTRRDAMRTGRWRSEIIYYYIPRVRRAVEMMTPSKTLYNSAPRPTHPLLPLRPSLIGQKLAP